MDSPRLSPAALAALQQALQPLRRKIDDSYVKEVDELAESWFRDTERRAEFLAFWWASYSRLRDRGDLPERACGCAVQNARRSVLRGSRFLESDYCGSVDPQSQRYSPLRSPRRPRVSPCACGACRDVRGRCPHCGGVPSGSLQNPSASYVDCLDPLPLRQLADRTDGEPTPELWRERGHAQRPDPDAPGMLLPLC